MTEPSHFYTVGGTLPPTARSYVTRHADHALLSHLLCGDFCYVLTSRQMGKSSLMVRTAGALRQNGVAVAILDLTRLGQNLTPEQWYDGLLVRLGAELKIADELDEYWVHDRVSRLGPMQRFIGALREVVLPSRKGNFVIFIDEIDSVRSLPFSSDEFFAGIRELYNSRVSDPELERISFCLLGVAQPSDLISNVNITPFNIGHRIELTDFTQAEAQPLLQGLEGASGTAEKNRDSTAILRRVLFWTGGHPYLTQRLCEALAQTGKSVTRADVDRACEELFLSSRSREKEDNLLFVRDRVLAEKEDRSSVLDLYAKVLRGKKIKDDDANPTIDVLRLSGIVSVSKGYLTVRNRIYSTVFNRDWVIANMPDAELRRQKAAYRRGLGFAASIGLVVLTIVAILGVWGYSSQERELREYFITDTAAAQQAFESGDMKTLDAMVSRWHPAEMDHESLLQWATYRWQTHAYNHARLLKNFSFLLLTKEKGKDPPEKLFPRRFDYDKTPKKDREKDRAFCGEFRAVASTRWKDKQLVAAGGADSVVYLWDASDPNHPKLKDARKLTPDPSGPYKLFHPSSLACENLQKSRGPSIMSLSFSPDGERLAISTGTWGNQEEKGHVLIWNMADPQKVEDLSADFDHAADFNVFSPDGRFLAASSDNDTAELWHISDPAANRKPTLFAPCDKVDSKTADGNLCKSRNADGTAMNMRQLVRNGANAVALSSPGHHLMALGFGDGHLVLYDYLRPQGSLPLFNQVVHVSGIMSLLFVDDKDLIVGTRDGDLLKFDPNVLITPAEKAETAKPSASLFTAQGVIEGLAISPDNKWLATSGSDGTVVLWSWPTLERTETLRGHKGSVYSVAFCQPATLNCLLSASQDGDLRYWNLPHAGAEEENITGTKLLVHGQVIGLAFLKDGRVVTGIGTTTTENEADKEDSGHIVFWSPSKKYEHPILVGGGAPIVSFAVSPDGEFVATSSVAQQLVITSTSGKEDPPIPPLPAHVTLSNMTITCSSKAGNTANTRTCPRHDYLIAGIADTTDPATKGLCLWRVRDNGPGSRNRFAFDNDYLKLNPCLHPVKTDFQRELITVTAVAFSTDGTKAVTALIHDGKTHVYVWRTEDLMNQQHEYVRSQPFPEQFYQIAFSPDDPKNPGEDGKYLAGTTITSSFYYWPTDQTDSVPSQALQNSATAATISDEKQEESALDLSARGTALAFSPPAFNVLAIGLENSDIVLWNTEYHRAMMHIHRHSGGVQALAFSPDGTQLASAGNDGRVILEQDSSKK
jgi:WD40 repeat protein